MDSHQEQDIPAAEPDLNDPYYEESACVNILVRGGYPIDPEDLFALTTRLASDRLGAGEVPATLALLQQRSSVTPASPPLTLTCLYLMFFSSVVLGICMYTFGCTMSTYISNKNAVEILKRHRPSSHSAASERCGCFYKEEAFWRI